MAETETKHGPQPFRGRRVGLRYDPAEDRLLLTLTDAAGGHQSYWLTRRLALGLVGLAQQEAERIAAGTGVAAGRRGTAAGAAVQQATRPATPQQVAAERGAARLLARVRVRRPKGACVLTFEPAGGGQATLALDEAGLGRFRGLVDTLARRAQWVAPAAPSAGPPAPAPRPKRRLH